MRDHPIFAPSWSLQGDIHGEEIVDAATLTLSNGESVSPLVWASNLSNIFGLSSIPSSLPNTHTQPCTDPVAALPSLLHL